MTETMTTTITISEQLAPELSGVDLAQVALHQAREAAKTRGEGGTRKAKRRSQWGQYEYCTNVGFAA
ncbi:hypothetical protein ABT096_29320 [Streptomyces sp. NPDC002561]|uniref:hypothetical protein n=1 Tax=Streptomyces sp. NPDC002561 TaxID=3154418 RepID=UPI00332DED72